MLPSVDSDYPLPGSDPEPAGAPVTDQPLASNAGVRRHPSAAAGEPVFPLADAGEYYIGLWNGHPNYGCPVCNYAVLAKTGGEGDFLVDSHIQEKATQGSAKHQALVSGEKGDNA